MLFDDNNDGEINETESSIDLEFFTNEVYEDVVEMFEVCTPLGRLCASLRD